MSTYTTARLEFESLPFYTGVSDGPEEDFPSSLPFTLSIRSDLELISQVPTRTVDDCNEAAYRRGSQLSTSTGIGEFGGRFLQNTQEVVAALTGVEGKRILEIGGGRSTEFLSWCLDLGAATGVAIEPGPADIARDARVKVIRDFFRPGLLREEFDLIVTHGVLEHLKEPLQFVKLQLEVLSAGGIVINAVPDSQRQLETGDPSMLAHEHYSYFTAESMGRLYELAGLTLRQRKASRGWMLYGIGELGEDSGKQTSILSSQTSLFNNYSMRLQNGLQTLRACVRETERVGVWGANATIAGYAQMSCQDVIPIDSDSEKQGKYLPGVRSQIEAPSRHTLAGLNAVIIAPIHYDEEIRAQLQNLEFKGRVISVKELLMSTEMLIR